MQMAAGREISHADQLTEISGVPAYTPFSEFEGRPGIVRNPQKNDVTT